MIFSPEGNTMPKTTSAKIRYDEVSPFLDERQKRLFAAAEAKAYGWGGVRRIAQELNMSTTTISKGMRELEHPDDTDTTRIRKPGGGRKKTVDTDPSLLSDLESLIEPATRGEPESALRWTSKSTNKLAAELTAMGHQTSNRMVCDLLHALGYSLQANRKTQEGASHPDRDAQFLYIHKKVKQAQAAGEPVISVDTKKKELVGDFKNAGQEWCPKGEPEEVRVHDFEIKTLGKVNPYGVYDLNENNAWVSVGTDHDTAEFAVESIRRWWHSMGSDTYPHGTELLITADGGGRNGYRTRLWKTELQRFADETGLLLSVSHLPPGTSKWNKIEHRLFSYITQNWRGRPLTSHEVIVNLIAATTTKEGLRVQCELDDNGYAKGIKISDEQLEQVSLVPDDFHGEWNYRILPSNMS